jgi:hypothetical protein
VRKYRDINPSSKEFYDAEETVLLATQRFIQRHIDEIERQLNEEKRPELRTTLEMMLEANRNILSAPPVTFLEACQWVAWYNIVTRIYDRDGAGFQLDVMLMPYYEKDIAEGRLNDDLARFILANLLLVETHDALGIVERRARAEPRRGLEEHTGAEVVEGHDARAGDRGGAGRDADAAEEIAPAGPLGSGYCGSLGIFRQRRPPSNESSAW